MSITEGSLRGASPLGFLHNEDVIPENDDPTVISASNGQFVLVLVEFLHQGSYVQCSDNPPEVGDF